MLMLSKVHAVTEERTSLVKSRDEEEEEEKKEKSNIGSQGCAAAHGRQPKNKILKVIGQRQSSLVYCLLKLTTRRRTNLKFAYLVYLLDAWQNQAYCLEVTFAYRMDVGTGQPCQPWGWPGF